MALAEILAHQQAFIKTLPDIGAALPPSERSFLAALQNSRLRPAVIAELKPKSPAQGLIAGALYQPGQQALLYKEGGAAALSVLTEARYFGGSFQDLSIAREASGLPVLCKDFIVADKQVKLARQAGADAVLLIVAALTLAQLTVLKQQIEAYKMLAVIEVHTSAELEMALCVAPEIILINNRNLWDLSMHPDKTMELLPGIPKTIPVISASGFETTAAITALRDKVTAVLVGTHLMQHGAPHEFLKSLQP